VLALNTAATYGGAAVAGTLAGLMYERAGFGWLAVTAAALLALAAPVTASRKPHSPTATSDQRDQIPGPR
jgi:predicted MFS family arabinose efflux permease